MLLRNHLTLLCELLHFPEWVIFDNRLKMLGEEVFLRGLYEIRSGSTEFDCALRIFLDVKHQRYAGNEPNALRLYTVATLFRNFHVWLYGLQISTVTILIFTLAILK